MTTAESNQSSRHCTPHLYPYALVPLGELQHHVRLHCTQHENDRLATIIANWTAAQVVAAEVIRHDSEAKVADNGVTEPIPEEFQSKLKEIADQMLFQKTFAMARTSFELVSIDHLVASQRIVNLDHVDALLSHLRKNLDLTDLLDVCLTPARAQPSVPHLEVAANSHVFSSENADFRFLGSFLRPIQDEDYRYASLGGVPAGAVIAFVGYGMGCVNVFKIGNRLILNNGFHRVYGLRKRGISRVPVVVQHVSNPHLEMPSQVVALPREYLIRAPRPVLMKDFFDPRLSLTLQARKRLKTVNINIGVSQYDVPV
jgi:hypothetical protein